MKGFSLLEVLIALTIFAISAFGIYGLLNQCLNVQDYTEKRLSLILSSTAFIYSALETPPEATNGWVYVEEKGIDAYKVTKENLGFQDIIKVHWTFRQKGIEVSYVLFY